ncbi:hypothetical protein K432DRAFT_399586 [Lepidopterella palustris CBS 459.81]|uniref:Uncharacterized protein n=1 Tax=Lepidopterella palustris CBS 459.81 TaxID=1314670 RepID=A0A8E2ELL6_9PEZI|nr:hypothetical protein K432DRAFT_399586 [Lepidopterella palustris CBS 459.81]
MGNPPRGDWDGSSEHSRSKPTHTDYRAAFSHEYCSDLSSLSKTIGPSAFSPSQNVPTLWSTVHHVSGERIIRQALWLFAGETQIKWSDLKWPTAKVGTTLSTRMTVEVLHMPRIRCDVVWAITTLRASLALFVGSSVDLRIIKVMVSMVCMCRLVGISHP